MKIPAAIPAISTIFYAAQAMMRDASGNAIQCDDTAKGEFIGFLIDLVRTQVDPIDAIQVNGLVGDKMFDIVQPLMFTSLIAAAAAGDAGRKVYWLFNNQVSYTPGASGNFAGQVWFVKDSTHVVVVPPWMIADLLGSKGVLTLSGSVATITLTKFDGGKSFAIPSTINQTITLPLAAKMGSGDQLLFIQIGTTTKTVTLATQGADLVNGGASIAMGTAQFSRMTVMSDGVSNWYQVG